MLLESSVSIHADNILLLKNGEYQMGTRDEMLCNIDSTKCSRLSEVTHE